MTFPSLEFHWVVDCQALLSGNKFWISLSNFQTGVVSTNSTQGFSRKERI